MALPTRNRSNVTRLRPRRSPAHGPGPGPDRHAWMVPHLISLIRYAELNGLRDAELALTEATEIIAPTVHPLNQPPSPPPRRPDAAPAQVVQMTDLRRP